MKFRTDTQSQKVVPLTPPVEDRSYLHTTGAGVVVPFLQALVTGFLFFAGAWLIGWLVFDVVDPIKPAALLTVPAVLFVWLWRLKQWGSLAAHIEQLTGLDLNNDGVIGKPDVVRLKWSNLNDGKNGPSYEAREADFPVDREQLVALAEGLMEGKSFSENVWTGPDKPFSINEFRAVRTVMYKRGLIELASDKDARQGFKLTDEGWSVMENLLNLVNGEVEEE
jgi:hypothetical protein